MRNTDHFLLGAATVLSRNTKLQRYGFLTLTLLSDTPVIAADWLKKPDFELYSAISPRATDNALQTPASRKFDGFILPVIGIIATGDLWHNASYRAVSFYSGEIYKQQRDAGFNRFSLGFTIIQKFEAWNISLQSGRRRTYDQSLSQLNSDAWTFGLALSRSFEIGEGLSWTPTIGASRRINVPVAGAGLIPGNLLDRTEAGQNGMIYRVAAEFVKTSGNWSLTLTPDVSRTINNPVLGTRTTETLASLDLVLGYKITQSITASINFSAIKAFSNDPQSRYHAFSGGPGASLTWKF